MQEHAGGAFVLGRKITLYDAPGGVGRAGEGPCALDSPQRLSRIRSRGRRMPLDDFNQARTTAACSVCTEAANADRDSCGDLRYELDRLLTSGRS
jgi:hypothetical protein